uniref:Uncharacterized protein n=1 Tax=Dunaliella tertiolecta TaxID=3047 RepID=A0A6S8IQC0_DUNTE|mmetsp:Transcript_11318/g.30880  ORF Transcript_11318/g.30880 Transcript_11318/m.30880 type:complete len:108 (+) Transcript_11318:323-646(+)
MLQPGIYTRSPKTGCNMMYIKMTVSKITGWMFNPSPSSTFTPTATTSKRGLPASYFTSCQSTILQGVPQQKGACLSTTPHVIHFVSTQLTGTLFFRGSLVKPNKPNP